MKTQPFLSLEHAPVADEGKFPVDNGHDNPPTDLGKRTILLISDDTRLHEDLRRRANTVGRIVVRLGREAGIAAILQVLRPTAVLLDMDLPKQAAWRVADALLREEGCPPVILFTGLSEQFDVKTAIRAGLLVDKSEGPSRLLDVAEETLAMPEQNQAERNAVQRVLIRWLKPCNWPVRLSPAHRFWGINE